MVRQCQKWGFGEKYKEGVVYRRGAGGGGGV